MDCRYSSDRRQSSRVLCRDRDGIDHQLTRKGTEVGHLGRIFRRNDETEMVAVRFAPFSERALIDGVGSLIEHTGMRAITGDAIPLQVSNVLYKRRRAEFISAMPNHARFDHNPT